MDSGNAVIGRLLPLSDRAGRGEHAILIQHADCRKLTRWLLLLQNYS